MSAALDIAIAAMRAGSSVLDADVIALEAMRDGTTTDAPSVSDMVDFMTAADADGDVSVAPIIDTSKTERIVYCVALQPNVPDTFGSVMLPESIAYTAHRFIIMCGTMRIEHMPDDIRAAVVESYIAPQDLTFDSGMYGAQQIAKGSWVVGIKVYDDAVWQGIVNGDYTGISVGGVSMQGDLQT